MAVQILHLPCPLVRRTKAPVAHGRVQESMDNVGSFDALVIGCLQDFREELQTPKCKQQVKKLTERASQDIRFDEPLADACYEDRARLCVGVQPVLAPLARRAGPVWDRPVSDFAPVCSDRSASLAFAWFSC